LQEVIAGNTVYDHDGSERWTYEYTTSNSSCGGTLDCDGYSAVGNFDDDDDPEIVIIRFGELFVLNHDGSPVDGVRSLRLSVYGNAVARWMQAGVGAMDCRKRRLFESCHRIERVRL